MYRAQWKSRGSEVAVKVMDLDMHARDNVDAERQMREGMGQLEQNIEVAARCERVCRILGASYNAAERQVCLVMPFMERGSLQARLEEIGGAMEEGEFLRMAVDVLWGLRDLHRAGMVHMDVKPDNVLLDEEGRGCLCDFGLMQWVSKSLKTRVRVP